MDISDEFSDMRFYTANGNNPRFLNPDPPLPRWGRELKENVVCNRLEYNTHIIEFYFLAETGIGIRPPPGITIGPGVWTRPRVNHPDLDALNKPHEDIQNSPNAEKKA